jgi:hypothetical protein
MAMSALIVAGVALLEHAALALERRFSLLGQCLSGVESLFQLRGASRENRRGRKRGEGGKDRPRRPTSSRDLADLHPVGVDGEL